MDLAEMTSLLAQEESQVLEFKGSVPTPDSLARILAGFANTDGGVVLLGVDERGNRAVGVDPHRADRIFHAALDRLDHDPGVTSTTLEVDGKSVVALEVERSPLTLTREGLLVRAGAQIRPASKDEARVQGSEIIQQPGRELDIAGLVAEIAGLTQTIATLTDQVTGLKRGASWPRQLMWVLLGAVVGLLLALPFDYVFTAG